MRGLESQAFFTPGDRGESVLTSLSEKELNYFKQMSDMDAGFAPKPDDFSSVYSEEEIAKDNARVERRRHDFAREGNGENGMRDFRAKLSETLVGRLGGAWLKGKLSRTSEFDDYTNGVDVVLEVLDDDGSVARLGIDVTTGADEADRKLRDIGLKADGGELSEVKYLKSKVQEGFKRRVEVPKVVLGMADTETIAKQYYVFTTTKDEEVKERARKNLMNPDRRIDFLSQIITQLDKIRSVLTKREQDEAVKAKVEMIDKLLKILERNNGALERVAENKKDDTGWNYSNSISSVVEGWRP